MHAVTMVLMALASVASAADAPGGQPVAKLVPHPKELQWLKDAPLQARDSAIVVGKAADPVERYAAEFLQARVEKRFGIKWPIIAEGEESAHPVAILLGRRDTHGQLKEFCDRRKLDLSESSPGFDGYLIETVRAGKQSFVLVGGSNARGLLYGTDTLFQLLSLDGDKLLLHGASIRDWPTVPWRGRPQTDVSQHLRPGIMDCYAASRINFIDLRKGIYAFEPGYEFTEEDKADIATTIKESHRRGIIVFGSVNCGVSRDQHEAVKKTFEEFMRFGVDGIWLSFDDRGPGEGPEELTFDMLGLAQSRGISPSRVAITPPKGSYQVIQAPFNAKIMKVPGMEQAWWFWTVLPSAEADAQAQAIGLQVKPSWWHNWPRPPSGLTHVGEGSQLADGRRSYLPLPSMAVGWHEPDYGELAAGGKHLHAVMPWGGNAWVQYYVVPVIGWWGWDAEKHDWPAVRARIYELVFGRSQVAAVREFDDLLTRVKPYFMYPGRKSEPEDFRPARLKDPGDRQVVLDLLDRLDGLLNQIEKRAAEETMLNQESLQREGLDAMRAEVQTGKIIARLAFPEYGWDDHQRAVLNAVYDGDLAKAERLIAAVGGRVADQAAQVGKELAFLRQIRGYANRWTETARRDAQQWQESVARRRSELSRRIWDYGFYVVQLSELLKNLNDAPLGRGYGAGSRGLRVLATALPAEREQYRGEWVGGVFRRGSLEVAAFAIDRRSSCNAGDYCELPVTLPVSGPRDRLGLLVFMNRSTKDSFGLELVPERWYGFASAQLVWEDRVVWEADLGLSRQGDEWDLVRLPQIAENVRELQLRLRVVDHKDSSVMQTFVVVGPIRLVELPE